MLHDRKWRRRCLRVVSIIVGVMGCLYWAYCYLTAWGISYEYPGVSKEIASEGVVVTIERLPNPDFLNCDAFCTSMDGTRYAFVNYRFGPVRNLFSPEGRFHVIVDGEVLREHSFFYRTPLLAGSAVDVRPSFSPDNAHLTYSYDGHAYLNGDEVTLPGYDQVLEVLFLPDSSPIYIATRDNVTHITSGKNRLVASDDYIEDIAVSADGTILYCVSRDVRGTNLGYAYTLSLRQGSHHIHRVISDA